MVTNTTWQNIKEQWVTGNQKIDAVIIGAKASERFCESFSTKNILKKVKEKCVVENNDDIGKMMMEATSLPEKYRTGLIDTIREAFEKYQDTTDVSENTAKEYCNWLKCFNSAYYLNFDYILHLCNARNNGITENHTTSDGFSSDSLFNHQKPNYENDKTLLYYPNGNMILIKENCKTKKIIYNNEYWKKVRDQATDERKKGKLPVFICEASYDDQLKAIAENHYLNYVYKQLEKLQGNVVLYGCEPNSTNNKQVIKYILNKGVKGLAISYQGDYKTNKQAFEQAINELAEDDDYFPNEPDPDKRIEQAERLLDGAYYFDQEQVFELSKNSCSQQAPANDSPPDKGAA